MIEAIQDPVKTRRYTYVNTEQLALEPTLLSSPPTGAPAQLPPPLIAPAPPISPLTAPVPHDLAPQAPMAPPTPVDVLAAPPGLATCDPVLPSGALPTLAPSVPSLAPAPSLTPASPTNPAALEQPVPKAAPTKTSTSASALRRRGPLVAGVALLAAAAVLAYTAITGAGDDTSDLPTPPPATESSPASPILVPIEDARNVVDDINDNTTETELLEDLGLDPTGQPIPPGYQFVTTDSSGGSFTVHVDTATGNYSVETSDGFGYRSIDGATVARSTPTDAWTPVDGTAVAEVQRFGLDRLTSESDIVTPAIGPWTTVESREVVDGFETTLYRVDVASLNAEQPTQLVEWAAPFGLDAASIVSAASAPIEIEIKVDAQRVVQSFTIAAPGANGQVSYRLETVYETAPTISL